MNRLFLSSDKQYCLRLNQAAVSREGGEQRGYDEGMVAAVSREGGNRGGMTRGWWQLETEGGMLRGKVEEMPALMFVLQCELVLRFGHAHHT